MNKIIRLNNHGHLRFTAILCATVLCLNSCTTQKTAYAVQTQPMSADLEKKVLRETGLSGAVIGGVVGGITGALVMGIDARMRGLSPEETQKRIAIGATAGAVGGGVIGYNQGRQKGGEMVAKSIGRDRLNQLLAGAQAQNQHLASFNAGLKDQIAKAGRISDPKEKRAAYSSLRKQSNRELSEANSRIELRNKALQNPRFSNQERNAYQSKRNDLVNKRNSLEESINQIAKSEQAIAY